MKGVVLMVNGISGNNQNSNAYNNSSQCETCQNRTYQDGSNEMVSFKSASHINPESAASVVRAHEGEHVSNAYDDAFMNGGAVVNASVALHTGVCPECGRTYVSGGTTTTQIKYQEENPYSKNAKGYDVSAVLGNYIDSAE